ncbi:DUF484 family protein [Thalassotalea atypica]|uniref:DUF484 family protein n=1 Tax=Thalassotalea atypica TaxID=2054316 RepID=UPI0025735E07|nr:DUF484 family protein [Thalassotalea atypica]
MSEQNTIHSDDSPLTDELVVSFLQDNPDFFNRNPALVTQLRIADSHRGTVSLVERQQQQLRQKVHGLEEEITHLMSMANQNEKLFHVYSNVYIELLDCKTTKALLDKLQGATVDLLALAEFKLWLSEDVDETHESIINTDCRSLMQTRLEKDEYYFGRLQQAEYDQLFSNSGNGSVVLIKLIHDTRTLGFIAFRSEDAEHFDPRMDTLLLSQFKRLVSKLLAQKLLDN